jgi:phospholipid/cholesterol/gamma-HCH transport system substrate-binding protein
MSIRTYSKVRIRSLGIVFIALMLAGVWLVVAIFNQDFTKFDKVSLPTDASGLQLPDRADVKVRGVIVGEVTQAVANPGGKGAVLTLGIDPSKIGWIPDNVTASILPKTLFGEKYVELNIPADAASQHLVAGDRITQTKVPIELENVLNDIYPLLTAIEPAQLNYTLNALANALDGRGAKLGHTLTTLNTYLTRFNPQVPGLVTDLKKLATVSGTYADVAPALATTLRNTVKTGNTLKSQQVALHQLLQQTAKFANTSTTFLNANGRNISDLANVSAPQLALLNRYSSTFPCFAAGLARIVPLLSSAFRDYTLHINLVLLPAQPRGYVPADKPVYGATNAPSCSGLPYPAGTPAHPYTAPNVIDGVDDHGGSLGRGDNQRVAPNYGQQTAPANHSVSGMDQLIFGASYSSAGGN